MGKIGKRVLSAVVALVMCIAVLPTNISFAATDVYTKVTSADDIVDGGKYVLATLYEETYKAVAGTADGSNAMDAVAVDVSGDQITNPSTDLVWTLEAGTGGFYLVNNAGSKLSCGSSGTSISLNSTGITWAFNVSGGLFNIVPSTQSTRQLMYRISSDQYRAYAQSNLGASDYGNSITVFKLDTAVEPEYTDIADVRAYETGVSATVQGTVTFIDGRNVYIQDSTGGIDLYLNSGTVPSTLAIGDKVQATGTTAEYRGLFELSGIDGNNAEVFNVISTGNELPLAEVTLAELASDEDTTIQLMESTRVLIKGLTLGTINTSGSTPATDAYGNSINIYKMPETSFVEGDIVDVIAIVSSFNVYQLRVASASDITETLIVDDPISDEIIPENVLNINEALAAVANEQISVIGQLVYRYGNYDSMNSAILQDVINGEIVAIQLYNSLDDYDIGDIVVVTGTKSVYGGVPQVQSLTATTLVKPAAETTLIPAQEFTTIASMLENKATLLSEWVLLREVTLGEYNSNGTTYVTDSMGTQIGIYRAASYPIGVTAGEVVDLYACLSAYNTTTQLRVGSQTDYVVLNDTSAPVVEFGTLLDAEVGKDYTVNATITDNVGVVSASLE